MMDRFISMRLNDARGFTREVFFFGAAADGSWSARGWVGPKKYSNSLACLTHNSQDNSSQVYQGNEYRGKLFMFLELTFRNKNSNEGMVKTITRYHNRFAVEEGVGRIISIG
jgi:hypothetical protein